MTPTNTFKGRSLERPFFIVADVSLMVSLGMKGRVRKCCGN